MNVILSKNCSSENEDVEYNLLTHPYEGNCNLLSSDFVGCLFELTEAEDKMITKESKSFHLRRIFAHNISFCLSYKDVSYSNKAGSQFQSSPSQMSIIS